MFAVFRLEGHGAFDSCDNTSRVFLLAMLLNLCVAWQFVARGLAFRYRNQCQSVRMCDACSATPSCSVSHREGLRLRRAMAEPPRSRRRLTEKELMLYEERLGTASAMAASARSYTCTVTAAFSPALLPDDGEMDEEAPEMSSRRPVASSREPAAPAASAARKATTGAVAHSYLGPIPEDQTQEEAPAPASKDGSGQRHAADKGQQHGAEAAPR